MIVPGGPKVSRYFFCHTIIPFLDNLSRTLLVKIVDSVDFSKGETQRDSKNNRSILATQSLWLQQE